ncbi:MAG: hypothetical protein JO033_00935 [Acidobacteriaceae bacterium]|nr:hypothetical protein [Acidobacteriaceae bacterium]MBV9501007.1 hypothetical protein [Acidobacteriaceae bacterium]
MLKRVGLFSLVLAGALAVVSPNAAKAADWHDRGESHERHDRDRGRERRGWGREDHDWHVRRDWDRGWRDRNYMYFNYAPTPRYYAPAYSSPYYYGAPYSNYPSYNGCPY